MPEQAYLVVFVKPGDTLSAIVRETLGPFRTHQQWMTAVAEVARRSAIHDPDRILPGQPVLLRPAEQDTVSTPAGPVIKPQECERMRAIWRATPKDEREIVEQHWDLLDWLNVGNNGIGGLAGAGVAAAQVELSNLRPPPPQVQVMLQERIQYVWRELIRVRRDTITTLRLSGITRSYHAVVRLVPDAAGQARYAARLRSLTTTARALRWVSKRSIGVSVGLAGYATYQDWDTPQRYRTATSQAAGVGLAMAGGLVGYTACNVALGFPTGGNSLWICALLVGAAAGSTLGEAGAELGGKAYDLATRSPAPPEGRAIHPALERLPLPQLR